VETNNIVDSTIKEPVSPEPIFQVMISMLKLLDLELPNSAG